MEVNRRLKAATATFKQVKMQKNRVDKCANEKKRKGAQQKKLIDT